MDNGSALFGINNLQRSETKLDTLRMLHNIEKEVAARKSHIQCPLCLKLKDVFFKTKNILRKRLEEIHQVSIEQDNLSFRSKEEFHLWMAENKRDFNCVCKRTNNNL